MEAKPEPNWSQQISRLPCLFSDGVSERTFEDEYRYLDMLWPRAVAALTRRCHGKWSAFDVLCHMRKKGWEPDTKDGDQKIADAILRRDRYKMGGPWIPG